MTIRNVSRLFEPASVAVIGASDDGIGGVIMRNLLAGGFTGPIMPVNPRRRAAAGVLAYTDAASLPITPELAVVATPPQTLPDIIGSLGERGAPAAIVVTEVADPSDAADDMRLLERIRAAARTHGLRVLGPGSLGVFSASHQLNASVSHGGAGAGSIAFVTQSGALGNAVLDWAREKDIGFSHFLALGAAADVDFADVLDYLAGDYTTRAILLYIESLTNGPRFMTAARAAARVKPVIAVKAGRQGGRGNGEASSYAAALIGPDDLFEAVLRRSGILPVRDVEELFDAVETLGRGLRIRGERLGIITSGGGTGTMARDALLNAGLEPAEFTRQTTEKLEAMSPPPRHIGGHVDLGITGPLERHGAATRILLAAEEVGATLVIHAPSSHEPAEAVARAVADVTNKGSRRRLLTAWMGGPAVAGARRVLAASGIAGYETPGSAVKAFGHLVDYHRNRRLLMQTPPLASAESRPEVEVARRIIAGRRTDGALPEAEAVELLAAYGINTVPVWQAANPSEAARLSEAVGHPVAMTLSSPDIQRIRDVGGIALYLNDAHAVLVAAQTMLERVAAERPGARVEGLILRRMVPRPSARQLFAGVSNDEVFGPAIVVGEGGRALEAYHEHAVGLPPLNRALARDLLSRSRIWQILHASRARPDADIDAICELLVRISDIVTDFPEIAEMDVNPIFADESGVAVAGAHIRLVADEPRPPMVVQPYPKALEELGALRDGRPVLLRPVRPEDEPLEEAFFSRVAPEDLYWRFFRRMARLERAELARLTQIDYDREMAFVAVAQGASGDEILGEVRTVTDPDNEGAEFAIIVRSDLKGNGLARALMDKMIRYCRRREIRTLFASVMTENHSMRRLAQALGMSERAGEDSETRVVELLLRSAADSFAESVDGNQT